MTGDPGPEGRDVCAALMAAEAGAVVDAEGQAPIDALQAWARDGADALAAAGLAAWEPVLLPVAGRAEDVAAILAVQSAGGVAVPIHERAHAETIAQIRARTAARFELRLSGRRAGGAPRLDWIAAAPPPPRPLLEGAGFVTFTSGSTGQPKGVVLSRARMAAKLQTIQSVLAMPRGARTAMPLQLIFSFGQWATFLTLLNGGEVWLSDRFDAPQTAAAIAEGRIDYLAAVPTMLRILLAEAGSDHPVEILTGGEAVGDGLRAKLFERWPAARIHSIFGLTETGTCDLFRLDTAEHGPAESLGFPAPNVAMRADPETRELQIRTPYAMLGYLDQPDVTAATIGDGWLRTGDAAEIAPTGEVRLVGRLKELINRAGNKVSPLEVEAVFAAHPALAAVLAAGAPDERLGEAIHLLVVPKPGATVSAAALRNWARERIERFKTPDVIHIADAVPLGATGKSDRGALRRMIEQGALG